MENIEIIRRVQLGDLDSLGELYRVYGKNALGTAYLLAGHKGIAEDIVHEAFIQCFDSIKRLKNLETFDVWFYKILVRTGRRMVSKYNYYIPVEDENMEAISAGNVVKSELDSSETGMALKYAIEKLSLPLRNVVILHYYRDMTIKEISEVLGCFQGTVKSRLHNARKQLYYELYGSFNDGEEQDMETVLFERKGFGINGEHV